MQAADITPGDLQLLLDSWLVSLRAEHKSPATLKVYGDGVRRFITWADEANRPPTLDRSTVAAFVADLIDGGAQPSTARSQQLSLRRFSSWLTEEGEIPEDRLIGAKPPKLDQKVVNPLTDDELKALLAACAGTEMRDRRDEALIRFMVETGTRAGEVAALRLEDLNLQSGTAIVRRGKGAKGRTVPFGPQTTRALDRYIRARRHHRLAESPALWLGDRGKPFNYDGLHSTLRMRARLASVQGFHPHRLRHTAAHRWLAAGGSEGGLMAVAGWTRPDMLLRYTRARAEERAAEEARNLNLGEI